MCPLLASQTPPQLGQPAPDFTLTDSAGSPVKLSTYKGKVVLLDFWATWCGGCKVEIPWYVEFQSKYRKDGLAAIGVSMDDDGWKSVKPFLEQHKLNYPVVIGNQDLASRYGGLPSLPMTLLIDRDGKIAELHAGMVDKSAFENKIKALLHESPAQ
jgi:peroxiredoxin